MKGSLASRRYAKSILSLALEGGIVDAVYEDMKLIGNTIHENRDLQNLLSNPIIKADKKQSVISAIFGGKVNDMSSKFMTLITSKGREGLLYGISEAYIKQYKEYKNIALVEVTSAVKLDDSQKAKIIAMVAKQGIANAEVVEKIDASIIGGFIVRIGDEQIDASVLNRLNQMRQELTKN